MSSLLLLLIILFSVSISACDARNLTVHANSTLSTHSRKDTAKVRIDEGASVQEARSHCSSNGFATLDHRLDGSEAQVEDAKRRNETVSGAAPIPSLVKSSWRVLRRGRRENPGFDVDYIGPRTHPPSHN